MNLEDELRSALRRENPSPGFTQRVLAENVARSAAKPQRAIPRMIWAMAMAALLVIGLTATYEARQMQAERAAREAVLALRIASEKLNIARDKVGSWEN